jgi:hypothetical protein
MFPLLPALRSLVVGASRGPTSLRTQGQCKDDGHLGASFFFRRRHQLASAIPELILPIQQVAESDPLMIMFGRAMSVQFKRLIVEPIC